MADTFDDLSRTVIPLLLEKSQRKQQRKHREDLIIRGYNLLRSDDPKDKLRGFAQLGSLGVNVPQNVLEAENRPDLTPFFSGEHVPEWLPTLYERGALDPNTAIQLGMRYTGTSELSEGQFNTLLQGGLLEGTGIRDYKTYKALTQAKADLGKDFIAPKDTAGETHLPSAMSKIQQGATVDDLSVAERAAFVNAFKDESDRDFVLNNKDDASDILKYGQTAIQAKIKSALGEIKYSLLPNYVAQWRSGTLQDKTVERVLDQYYDKGSGTISNEAIAREGMQSYESIKDIRRQLENDKPERADQIMSFVEPMLALPPSQISLKKIGALMQGTYLTLDDIRDAYMQGLKAQGMSETQVRSITKNVFGY